MAFENKTSETLTNVQAWFYEPNESGDLIQVDNPTTLDIAPNSTATFKIPDGFYSYVKFTWNEGNSQNPAKSITSMVKMLMVMIKNPLHTVIQVTALSILAQTTKDGV